MNKPSKQTKTMKKKQFRTWKLTNAAKSHEPQSQHPTQLSVFKSEPPFWKRNIAYWATLTFPTVNSEWYLQSCGRHPFIEFTLEKTAGCKYWDFAILSFPFLIIDFLTVLWETLSLSGGHPTVRSMSIGTACEGMRPWQKVHRGK